MRLTRTVALVIFTTMTQLSLASALTGVVKLTSSVPKRKQVKMSADPVCVKQNGGKAVMDEDIVTSDTGTLANVFVYLKDGVKPGSAPSTTPKPATLDQRGCWYIPHVWGVLVNQPFTILNSDPTLHNVHSMAKNNSNFNMGMATAGQKIEKKFAKPEVMIRIKCDVHGWMNTFVAVLDHPYFSVTSLDGRFSLGDVPPGEYTIAAWQEKLGEKSQKITVEPGASSKEVGFTF